MTWEDAPIEALGLSTRLNNVLRARGVVTLGKLLGMKRLELSYIPYLGPSATTRILHKRELFLLNPEAALHRWQEAEAARERKTAVITAATPLADLNLPSRPKSALRVAKIKTVGQLCAMTRDDLLGLGGFGPISLALLEPALTALGLALAEGPAREPKAPRVRRRTGHQRGSFRGIRVGPIPAEVAGKPLETLPLSGRALGVLKEHGIATIGELEGQTMASLLAIRRLGMAVAREILRETAALRPAGAGRAPFTVDELYLSNRARHSLARLGVSTISELCALTREDLRAHKGIGRLSVGEIERALLPFGLSLAGAGAEAAAGRQGDEA